MLSALGLFDSIKYQQAKVTMTGIRQVHGINVILHSVHMAYNCNDDISICA